MTDKKVKNLSRAELLEILVSSMKENEALSHGNEHLKNEISSLMKITESQAETLRKIGEILSEEDGEIDDTVKKLSSIGEDADRVCKEKIALAQRRADEMLEQARIQADELVAKANKQLEDSERKIKLLCERHPEVEEWLREIEHEEVFNMPEDTGIDDAARFLAELSDRAKQYEDVTNAVNDIVAADTDDPSHADTDPVSMQSDVFEIPDMPKLIDIPDLPDYDLFLKRFMGEGQ